MPEYLFQKSCRLECYIFIKETPAQANFAKFLKTSFLIGHLRANASQCSRTVDPLIPSYEFSFPPTFKSLIVLLHFYTKLICCFMLTQTFQIAIDYSYCRYFGLDSRLQKTPFQTA